MHKGEWAGKRIVPASYYDFAWKGTSVKADYGGQWWTAPHIPGAPGDLVMTLGRNHNDGFVVPSLDLVFVRLGDGDKFPKDFEKDLVLKVLAAVVSERELRTIHVTLLPILLLVGGLAVAAVAWLWLIVRASREDVGWGLGTLLLPPVGLLFALRHAQRAIGPLVAVHRRRRVRGGAGVPVLVTPAALDPQPSRGVAGRGALVAGGRRPEERRGARMDGKPGVLLPARRGGGGRGGLALADRRAFRQQWKWGVGTLVLPPTGFVFAARHPRKGAAPLILAVAGLLVAAAPAVYTLAVPLDLGPRETIVEGERHLTLTGWDRKDYSVLTAEAGRGGAPDGQPGRDRPDPRVAQGDEVPEGARPQRHAGDRRRAWSSSATSPRWRRCGWPGPRSPTRASATPCSPRIR